MSCPSKDTEPPGPDRSKGLNLERAAAFFAADASDLAFIAPPTPIATAPTTAVIAAILDNFLGECCLGVFESKMLVEFLGPFRCYVGQRDHTE